MTEAMITKSLMSIAGTLVEFISCDIKETIDIIQDEGIRGTRARALERLAQGQKHVAGSIVMEPTPVEVALVLPYCVQSSTGTTLTDALQDVTVILDTITKKYTYSGRFTKITFSGEPGQKVRMKLDFVGYSLTVASTSLTGTPDITVRPYLFSDSGSGLTIASTAYSIDQFELSIDNRIVPTYMQGQVATDLEPTDRIVTLNAQVKYTSTEQGLLTTAQAGPVAGTPLTGSIAFTNGSNSMTFTFASLVVMSQSVVAPNRAGKFRLPLNMQAYKASTTLEVVPVLV